MLTNKQKQQLRKIVINDQTVFQIGKNAINENMLNDIHSYLDKHEIMKISILNNSPFPIEEVVATLEANNMHIVNVIGRVVTVYKHSRKAKNPIRLVK